MQINAPSRDTALSALNARTQELIRQGDLREAERIQRDMVILEGARGDNLYDIHRNASDTCRSIRWPEGESLSEWSAYSAWPIPVGMIGGLVGGVMLVGGLAIGPPVVAGIGGAVLGTLVAGGLYAKHRMDKRNHAMEIMHAAERNQDYIRGFVPSAPQPGMQIDRKVFMAALQGQEAALAENGSFQNAGEMRRVHERLGQLPGDTVEELFQNLIASGDREILNLVQGSCSGPIAEAIETIAQVGKLVAPEVGSIREQGDTIVIGGVVLKKNPKAA